MNTEQINELQKKNLDAAMRLMQLSIDNSQKMMAVQSGLAKDLFETTASNTKSLSGSADVKEAIELRTKMVKDTSEKVMSSAKKIAEINNESRAEFSRILTEQLASGNHEMMNSFQSFFNSMSTANPALAENIQDGMQRVNAAFEQITKSAADAFNTMAKNSSSQVSKATSSKTTKK